jgi:hypothetical protein
MAALLASFLPMLGAVNTPAKAVGTAFSLTLLAAVWLQLREVLGRYVEKAAAAGAFFAALATLVALRRYTPEPVFYAGVATALWGVGVAGFCSAWRDVCAHWAAVGEWRRERAATAADAAAQLEEDKRDLSFDGLDVEVVEPTCVKVPEPHVAAVVAALAAAFADADADAEVAAPPTAEPGTAADDGWQLVARPEDTAAAGPADDDWQLV